VRRATAGDDDFRCGHLPHTNHGSGGRLLQPDLQVAIRVFEFLEVVLAHIAEELLDNLEFGVPYRGASSRFRGLFAFHAFLFKSR